MTTHERNHKKNTQQQQTHKRESKIFNQIENTRPVSAAQDKLA